MFATLREILSQRHSPWFDVWRQVRELFEHWDDETQTELAIAYADEHLNALPDAERELREVAPDKSYWPLVRQLVLSPEAITSITPETPVGHITALLCYSGYGLKRLDTLRNFTNLQSIDFSYCQDLESLDGIQDLPHLRSFSLSHGYLSRNNPFPQALDELPTLKQLRFLGVNGYYQASRLPLFAKLSHLTGLAFTEFRGELRSLDFLRPLAQLETLRLSDMQHFPDLEELNTFVHLTELDLKGCRSLESIDALQACSKLTKLSIGSAERLKNLDGLQALTELTELSLRDFPRLNSLEALEALPHLHTLSILRAPRLRQANALASLSTLKHLDLSQNKGLRSIDFLQELPQLQSLKLSAKALSDFGPLSHLHTLEHLEINNCEKLTHLDALAPLEQLSTLRLTECRDLSSIDHISSLQGLEQLTIAGCKSLETIEAVATLKQLRKVSFSYSRSIKDVTPLCELPALHQLTLTGCSGIKKSFRSQHYGKDNIQKWREKVRPKPSLPTHKQKHATLDLPADPKESQAIVLATYTPPKNRKEAHAIAALGNHALPLLKAIPKQKPTPATAAIHALGLIGTPEAYQTLQTYRDDKRKAIVKELIRVAPAFASQSSYTQDLLAHRELKKLDLYSAGIESISCLKGLTTLQELNLSQNRNLSSLDGIETLTALRSLDLAVCSGLYDISALTTLSALETLRLYWLPITTIEALSQLSALQDLDLHGCQRFHDPSPLSSLTTLRKLKFTYCHQIHDLSALSNLHQLQELELSIDDLDASLQLLSSFPHVHQTRLSIANRFDSLDQLAFPPNTRTLQISLESPSYGQKGPIPEELNNIGQLQHLEELRLFGFEQLKDASSLANPSLRSFMLFGARALEGQTLASLDTLETLEIFNCPNLHTLDFVRGMTDLQRIILARCPQLHDISALQECPQLSFVSFRECPQLPETSFLQTIPELTLRVS